MNTDFVRPVCGIAFAIAGRQGINWHMKPTTKAAAVAAKALLAVLLGLAAGWPPGGTGRAADAGPGAAQPVDLTGQYAATLASMTNANWLAWKTMPVGRQVFHHVPFDIGGEIYLWGEGRATNHSSLYPEKVSIAVGREFQTLYVLHGSYYKTPDDTPVFRVVFRYGDGTAATNTLRFGADVLDWMVSAHEEPMRTPYAAGSSLAWVGGQFSETQKNRLRYCMTAVENPQPGRTVAAVDLVSCKTRTIPFILALTTGPAGLMADGAAKR